MMYVLCNPFSLVDASRVETENEYMMYVLCNPFSLVDESRVETEF